MKLFEYITQLIVALIVSIIFTSCAQVGTPTGGGIDNEPPIILEMIPQPGSTGVKTDKGGMISVTFDEYVNVKSLNSQLLVSPLLPQGLQWTMKGKTVTFVWNDELEEDKTYVFQFGDAVVDIREGNSVDNFVYAFSTGDHLDTLSVSGSVVDVFTSEPKSGVRVLMYDASTTSDSIYLGAKPMFVGTTNESGVFSISYLPSGRYKIMAIEDNDRNYVLTPGEGLAIFEEDVVVDGNVIIETPLRMQKTNEEGVKYFEKSNRDSLGLVSIVLSGGLNFFDIIETDGLEFFHKDENLWVMSGDNEGDGGDIVWCGNDTLNFEEIEVVQMEEFTSVKGPEGKVVSSNKAEFIFSRPLENVADSMFELVMSDSLLLELDSIYIDELYPFKVSVEGKFKRGNSFELRVAPGGVSGYGGVVFSDTVSFKWSVFEKKELGELRVTIDKTGWVELLASNGVSVATKKLNATGFVVFNDLTPGTYQLKWTSDPDGDGIWEGVNLLHWRSPDEAQLLKSKVKIKADWSHEVEWVH